MNYSHFRLRAAVDWIELEIQTAVPTNFQTIRRMLGVGYVKAQNAGEGGAATIFTFRIQDPARWHDVSAKLLLLPQLVTLPKVVGVELALDAYSNAANREELVELAARLHKFDTAPASANRRFGGRWKGDVEAANHFASNKRRLMEGRVINVGNKSDPRSQRTYVKSTDNNGVPLQKVQEHRARFENTFKGAGLVDNGLPCATEAWECFRFESLSKFYRFRTLKDGLDPITATVMETLVQVGERKTRKRKEGGTRLHAKPTQADTVLNDLARDALRKLSLRWQRVPAVERARRPASALAVAPDRSACGFTGTPTPKKPNKHGESFADSNNYTNNFFPSLAPSSPTTELGDGARVDMQAPEAVAMPDCKFSSDESVSKISTEKNVCTPST